MNYDQTLHFLYNKLPLYSQIGAKAYKADLKNTLALCEHLDNPQHKIKTIHIAGTNGKGSTSHILSAIFQNNNYKTGLYTSPHLKDFRERIKINGELIPQSFVIDFVEKIKDISAEIKPSFFELTFVMALEYFAEQKVDVAIIETGLGGRLDSTNVITPLLSIITNIGYDHMDILGDTLEKIAFEKAGIIKKNVPVVIGEYNPQTRKVFEDKASQTHSEISFAEDSYSIISVKYSNNDLKIETENKISKINKKYQLDLNGLYQQKNLKTVLSALDFLKKHFTLGEEKVQSAVANVKQLTGLHGRWEVIHKDPLVVLDVAHNVDGIQQLVRQINAMSFQKLRIVFGMVKDKDIEEVLKILPTNALYYFTKAPIPRALDEEKLKEQAGKYLLKGDTYPSVAEALKAALEASSPDDMVLVCGSVFIVGEVDLEKANG